MKRISSTLLAFLLWASPIAASQNTIVMPTAGPLTMAQVMTILNAGLNTIATNYSGSTPPAVSSGAALTYQFWIDTSASPRVLRMYDGTSWVAVGTLDTTAHAFTVSVSQIPNTQSGTSYTFTDADKGSFKVFSNAGAVTASLPAPGSGAFSSGWFIDVRYTGSATATLTPSGSTIDGDTSLTLTPGKSCRIVSDGTNYITTCSLGRPSATVLGGIFSSPAVTDQFMTGIDSTGTIIRAQPSVSNLSDSASVVTLTGAQTLTNKTLTSPAITTPTGLVKGDVGLGNVDNTSDSTKNAAIATLTNKTFDTSSNSLLIAGLAVTSNTGTGAVVRGSGASLASPAITTPTGIVKGDVGLGNVDNTSDATKNAATATLTNKTISAAIMTGIVDIQGVQKFTGISTPATIGANQNDYNPGSVNCTVDTLRLTSSASYNITGLGAPTSGCQMTLFNVGSNPIVLKDQDAGSSASNRFALGGDATIAASGSYTVRYDGSTSRWRALLTPGSGGGGGGVSSVASGNCLSGGPITTTGTLSLADDCRQSILLDRGYLAKVMQPITSSSYRKVVNSIADGFKGSDGINATLSLNYLLDTANGKVGPTFSAGTYTQSGTQSGTTVMGASAPSYTYVNRNTLIANNTTICYIGISLASAETITLKIIRRVSSTVNDIVYSQSFSHPGGGYANMAMSSCYTTAASGSFYPAVWFPNSAARNSVPSVARSYYNGDPAVQNGLSGWVDDTSGGPALQWAPAGAANAMTLTTTAQTSDAAVNFGRGLQEFDNTATPTLNTDLTNEVTCSLLTSTVTITIAAPGVITQAAHGLSVNAPVTLFTTGALPTGLTAGTVYYVKTVVDANSYTLSSTPGGSAISTSGSQSGVHTVDYSNWASASLSQATANSQSGRRVAESVDQACGTSGTSWALRVRTFNGKNIPIYVNTATFH